MIESSLAFQADTTKTADPAYTQWQGAMAATRTRQNSMRYDINDRTAGPMPTFGSMVDKASMFTNEFGNAYAPSQVAQTAKPDIAYEATKPDDQLSFGDVIDIINPLQHLPVIGTLYRKFTGDTMKGFSEIIGGAIYGGPVGAIGSTIDVAVRESTGKDMAENVLSLAGIDVSPAKKASSTLTYLPTPPAADLAGTTLAVANLSLARDGRHSFAARTLPPTTYNS